MRSSFRAREFGELILPLGWIMHHAKWRDLLIAFGIASLAELTPASNWFYKLIYLPLFREPLQDDMLRLMIQGVGWCFYTIVIWVFLQLMSFLVGKPSE